MGLELELRKRSRLNTFFIFLVTGSTGNAKWMHSQFGQMCNLNIWESGDCFKNASSVSHLSVNSEHSNTQFYFVLGKHKRAISKLKMLRLAVQCVCLFVPALAISWSSDCSSSTETNIYPDCQGKEIWYSTVGTLFAGITGRKSIYSNLYDGVAADTEYSLAKLKIEIVWKAVSIVAFSCFPFSHQFFTIESSSHVVCVLLFGLLCLFTSFLTLPP